MLSTLLIIASSYLLGSIPFGYLLVRIFRGEDVRSSGSGNIGATNVARKSPMLGVITLLLDAAKGAAAVLLAVYITRPTSSHCVPTRQRFVLMSLAALFAIVGHIFPVWLKFRGGKGVATALGAFALISPSAVLVSAVIFVIVLGGFRYVSLGSITAVAAFPFIAWAFHQSWTTGPELTAVSLSAALIIARHHANIRRLLAGTENRLGSKRSAQNAPPPARSEKR